MRNISTGQFEKRDFTGYRTGFLTMTKPTGERDKWGYMMWEAQCDCGNIIVRSAQKFRQAKPIRSCGCGPKGRTPTQTHLEALFKKHRLNAGARKIPFDLDPATHAKIVSSPCAYCGDAPSDRPHPYLRVRITTNTIDRIDSSQGYASGNCAPACVTCNSAKMDMGVDQFKTWIARAYAHLHG